MHNVPDNGHTYLSEDAALRATELAQRIVFAHMKGDHAQFYELIEANPLNPPTVHLLMTLMWGAGAADAARADKAFAKANAAFGGSKPKSPHADLVRTMYQEFRSTLDNDHQTFQKIAQAFRDRNLRAPSDTSMRRWVHTTTK